MAFGFEAYRADGSVMISSKNGVARLIFSGDYNADFSGVISVPEFDSTIGYFSYRVYPYLYEASSSGSGLLPDDRNTTSLASARYGITPSYGPDLQWDNATKALTITPNNDPEKRLDTLYRHRYRITMVHFK